MARVTSWTDMVHKGTHSLADVYPSLLPQESGALIVISPVDVRSALAPSDPQIGVHAPVRVGVSPFTLSALGRV